MLDREAELVANAKSAPPPSLADGDLRFGASVSTVSSHWLWSTTATETAHTESAVGPFFLSNCGCVSDREGGWTAVRWSPAGSLAGGWRRRLAPFQFPANTSETNVALSLQRALLMEITLLLTLEF